jgi:hypothetical protein
VRDFSARVGGLLASSIDAESDGMGENMKPANLEFAASRRRLGDQQFGRGWFCSFS